MSKVGKVSYFVAWMQQDIVEYINGVPKLKYRVLRDEIGGMTEPITEAMTRNEANEKLKEILTVLGELDGYRQGRAEA